MVRNLLVYLCLGVCLQAPLSASVDELADTRAIKKHKPGLWNHTIDELNKDLSLRPERLIAEDQMLLLNSANNGDFQAQQKIVSAFYYGLVPLLEEEAIFEYNFCHWPEIQSLVFGDPQWAYFAIVCYPREQASAHFADFIAELEESAANDDATSAFLLSCAYDRGFVVQADQERALQLLKYASSQGLSNAQCDLGIKIIFGDGVEKNLVAGLKWIKASARNGFAHAQYELGEHYRRGRGVVESVSKAKKWYKRAAGQGHCMAKYALGDVYRDSKPKKSFGWYLSAAVQGLSAAEYRVGKCYWRGRGTEKDRKTAIYWFQRAANSLHSRAIRKLGIAGIKEVEGTGYIGPEIGFEHLLSAAEFHDTKARRYLAKLLPLNIEPTAEPKVSYLDYVGYLRQYAHDIHNYFLQNSHSLKPE